MPEDTQERMWAYLPLPCDLTDVSDLSKWMVVTGDPVALLAEVEAFIGYQAHVPELLEKVRAMLEPYEQHVQKGKDAK